MNEDYKNPTYEYELIDWSKKRPDERFIKKSKLTEYEAETLNKGLMLNRTTLRYVKV